MTDQTRKAKDFAALHVKGAPIVLHNIWDAGSASAVVNAGDKAVATGSWAVAAAQGYGDGHALPLDDLLRTSRQIVDAVDVPVSVDFEGGYALTAQDVAENLRRLLDTGAVGINFEDQVVGGKGLHDPADQAKRIAAIRLVANQSGIALFINARTDVFFHKGAGPHASVMTEAVARAEIYKEAGADGIFVPGLTDANLIAEFCVAQALPVNVMRMGAALDISALVECGVSRISHGPGPYIATMEMLTASIQKD